MKQSPLKRNPQKAREWRERSNRKAIERQQEKRHKPLKRRSKASRGPSNAIAAQGFRLAAEEQRCCAKCGAILGKLADDGRPIKFDAHHVVEKSYLKANGLPMYDGDNALLLCDYCHLGQTNRLRPLEMQCLTDANIRYAFYLLGEHAASYLSGHYTGEDPRINRHLEDRKQDERVGPD